MSATLVVSASRPSASLVIARTACFAVTSRAVCWSTAARPASKAAARLDNSIPTTRESSERGVGLRRGDERGGVLGDPLGEKAELTRILDLALARPLLRRALRELDQLLAALRDRGRALGDVDQ